MKSRKGSAFLWTLLMVVLVIVTSGIIAVYSVFLTPDGRAVVPVLLGKTLAEAVSDSERLGLVVQVEPVASTLPEGRVLAQSPESGQELRKGQVIVLQVAQGGELHNVPDVRGQSVTQAQNAIKDAGFTPGDVIRIRDAKAKAGSVIAQSPAAPAKILSGRKIDLLVQESSTPDGTVLIPDVNKLTEKEARAKIEEAGLKVNGVERAYSPALPEGSAIETRPQAGGILRVGQGVILKLSTQKRPAGFDDNANANTTTTTAAATTTKPSTTANNATVRRVTSQTTTQQPANTTANATTPAKPAETPATPAQTPAPATQTEAPKPAPAEPKKEEPAQPAAPASTGATKTARVRYQVPPLATPMNLRIEVTDTNGTRDVLNRQARSGETVNTSVSYNSECLITIYLGGQSVWQERQK